MTTVLEGAVLAVVIDRPGHGHDLGQRFVERYWPVLRSSDKHVYPVLNRLARRRLVQATEEPLEPPPPSNRIVGPSYRALGAGVEEWRAWLASPLEYDYALQQVLTRLRAVRRGDWDTMLGILDRFDDVIRHVQERDAPRTRGYDELLDGLVDDFDVAHLDAALTWSERARDRIERRMRDR